MTQEFVKPYDPDYDKLSIDTQGLVGAGEVYTRLLREAVTEPDYRESWASGAVEAYTDIVAWAEERIGRAGPYDDMRAVQELLAILGDKIREVRSKATNGDQYA